MEAAIVSEDLAKLKKMFCKRIAFGTAGLRSVMGAGYANMNYVTVQQTSQGLAKYLIEFFGKDKCAENGIAIGYDGRYNSYGFAHITAATFKYYGFKV